MKPLSVGEADAEFRNSLSRALADGLKTLIETKHIYQRVTIDPMVIANQIKPRVVEGYAGHFQLGVTAALGEAFVISDVPPTPNAKDGVLTLGVGNVKTFCAICKSREVAAPVWMRDIVADANRGFTLPGPPGPRAARDPTTRQLWAIAFRCQRCKGDYDAYLVRRVEWQLSLEGRSPMENIEVPSFVPKAERSFYRDSLIALHGGKTLAAFFYLRTFIERFARRQTGNRGRATGDEIMSAYSALLPEVLRGFMPSLKGQYDRLSEAIHGVSEDVELFQNIRETVDHHFDLRRVHKIRDAAPPESESATP